MGVDDKRITAKDRFLPCLLDRLTDSNPDAKNDPVKAFSVQQLKQSVTRDLATLLNSKSKILSAALEKWPQLPTSVLNYGMDDFCGRFFQADTLSKFEEIIKTAIIRFEPRIEPASIKVLLLKSEDDRTCSTFYVQIEGLLHVHPLTDEMSIKMKLDLDSGCFNT